MRARRPSFTAEATALMRASDQLRPVGDRIVDDPYAAGFLGPITRAALAALAGPARLGVEPRWLAPGLTTFTLTRHRFIDDALARALAEEGAVEQVVLLGAGYDTRAHRFAAALAGRTTVEIDHPATAGRKRRLLAGRRDLPEVPVHRIEIDFASQSLDERLRAEGFASRRRTFWVWEGVSPYLTRAAVQGTLATLAAHAAPGSRVAMDFWYLLDAPGFRTTVVRASSQLLSLLGEPVTFGLHPDDAPSFVGRLGFEVEDLADAAELERRYVRDGRRVYPACYVILLTK